MELVFVGVVYLILILFVMVSIAFLTLLERKVLGYIQIRKGPNKVGYMGLLQPFGDAIKLFTSESGFLINSNYFVYYLSPILGFSMCLIMWGVIPFLSGFLMFKYSLIFILCCSTVSVYSIVVAGWSSNSNYALLGGLRAVAQSVSYEVSLSLVILGIVCLSSSYKLDLFSDIQNFCWLCFVVFPLFLIWVSSMLAETNRTPFDFAEGESELVSGFNVEYMAGAFALIFLAEYGSVILMSLLISLLFMGGMDSLVIFKTTLLAFVFLWVRGTLPRFRYDKLMNLAWKIYLSVSLVYLVYLMNLFLALVYWLSSVKC